MNEDVSRKAVLILVALAVVISVLSTTLVMNSVYQLQVNPSLQEPSSEQVTPAEPTSKVTLTIPEKAAPITSTGRVALEVPNSR